MSGTNVTKLKARTPQPKIIILTPEMAIELLESNELNRPLSTPHVQRIARQIKLGKWIFNGDTIKVAENHDVIDGQHRLWAIIEAQMSVETILIRGIKREAFSTIDTIRKPRLGGDVMALNGISRYRTAVSGGLQWLLRWQREVLPRYRVAINRIENSDLEAALEAHPGMEMAAEKVMVIRRLANTSIMAFFYYTLCNRDEDLAGRMLETLIDPVRVAVNDPFFRLREYLMDDHLKRKDPIMTIALCIKAANAASAGKPVEALRWRNQGNKPEAFPILRV